MCRIQGKQHGYVDNYKAGLEDQLEIVRRPYSDHHSQYDLPQRLPMRLPSRLPSRLPPRRLDDYDRSDLSSGYDEGNHWVIWKDFRFKTFLNLSSSSRATTAAFLKHHKHRFAILIQSRHKTETLKLAGKSQSSKIPETSLSIRKSIGTTTTETTWREAKSRDDSTTGREIEVRWDYAIEDCKACVNLINFITFNDQRFH